MKFSMTLITLMQAVTMVLASPVGPGKRDIGAEECTLGRRARMYCCALAPHAPGFEADSIDIACKRIQSYDEECTYGSIFGPPLNLPGRKVCCSLEEDGTSHGIRLGCEDIVGP